jgi:hypothetical protein
VDPAHEPVHAQLPRHELVEAVETILREIRQPEFADPERQTKVMNAVQKVWIQVPESERLAIQHEFTSRLHISDTRFQYLRQTDDLTDLRLGFLHIPDKLKRDRDEEFYPSRTDGWLGRYVDYAAHGEAHIGWHFWSGLIILGAACRRNFFILGGHKKLFPNFYTILEGRSGRGKNAASERAIQLLRLMNHRITTTINEADRQHTVHIFPNKMTPPILVTGLANARRRSGSLKIEPEWEHCGLIFAEEMTTLLGREQWGSEQMISLLTQAYDGRMEDATLTRNVSLENVVISVLMGSTIQWLRGYMNEQVFQGGFLGARCLIIPKGDTTRSYPWEPIIDPIERSALADSLREYAEHEPVAMTIDSGAKRAYEEWYEVMNRPSHEDDRINAYFGRRRVHLLKLAMLTALSRGHVPVITLSDMQFAIDLLMHEEPGMIACFREILTNDSTGRMENLLAAIRNLGGHATRGEMWQRMRSRFTASQLDEALHTLLSLGEIGKRVRKTLQGRRIVVYYRRDLEDEDGNLIRANGSAKETGLFQGRHDGGNQNTRVRAELTRPHLDAVGDAESLPLSDEETLADPGSNAYEPIEPSDE